MHRIRKSNRLSNYDYSSPGWYYLTVCTANREEYFGEIEAEKMTLNVYGETIKTRLLWLPENFKNIHLDEWIIMPNHLHLVLAIKDLNDNLPFIKMADIKFCELDIKQRRHSILSKTINALKSTASNVIHQTGFEEYAWQRSFYDHIIRKESSLLKIREYIKNNPANWKNDRNGNYDFEMDPQE